VIAEKLTAVIADPLDALRHSALCIGCQGFCALAFWRSPAARGCEYLDRLRFDPAFKLACGRLLDSGLGSVLVADHLALGETLRACAIISRTTWAQAIIEALRHNAARRPLAR
jgi:hypothetical protein